MKTAIDSLPLRCELMCRLGVARDRLAGVYHGCYLELRKADYDKALELLELAVDEFNAECDRLDETIHDHATKIGDKRKAKRWATFATERADLETIIVSQDMPIRNIRDLPR